MFEYISEFKQDSIPLPKDFDIKPILKTNKNSESNSPVERVHQVMLNMLVTKDLDKKVFEYIYPWGETLAYISWAIKDSYNCTIMTAPSQYIFGKYMVFNLASVVY